MNNEQAKLTKSGFIILAILVVLCLAAGITAYVLNDKQGQPTDPAVISDDADQLLLYEGGYYRLRDDLETVLLMGVDKTSDFHETAGGSVNYQQADFLMLLLLDKEQKKCVPLQINRDTMCVIWQLDIYGDPLVPINGQITLAHAYGSGGKDSCRNQVRAVSDLLYGMKIDNYISVTMDAVPALNDLVGGVTVTVLDDFSKISDKLVQGSEVTLTGDLALEYVRGRMSVGDGSNISRMARQRQYLVALRAKMQRMQQEDPNFQIKAISAVSDGMVTDCSTYRLSELAEMISTYEFDDIQTIAGEATAGEEFMEFYADEDALYRQVIELFYDPEK
ncbi:MAG: LCP family protein [Oscillospiraceae bacterium]|nr:LCP family protein [Oscillospiraceae bacterium]